MSVLNKEEKTQALDFVEKNRNHKVFGATLEKMYSENKYFINDSLDGTGDNIAKIREDIWKENEKGKICLLRTVVAEILMSRYKFITIGDKALEIYYYSEGIYVQGGEKKIGETMQRWTSGHLSCHDVREVEGHIKRQTYTEREDLDNPSKDLICINNGVFNLKTKELLDHDPKYKFTKKINCNYEPEVDCPNFKKFLSEVLNPEDIPVIQEYMGYLLIRDYFIKKAMILVGEKNTGKTTLIKAIVNWIGEKNTSGVSLHRLIYDKFSSANLHNTLLNFYDDLSFKDIKETGAFKIATGGGYVSAEKKFGECFEFINYAKMIFATNKISTVEDTDDDAYYDRWLILCFNNSFDNTERKKNPRVFKDISTQKERAGMLNFAIAGLDKIMQKEEFSYTKTAEDNRLLMERSSNTVSAFIQDCIKEEQGSWTSKEDLYDTYSLYIKYNGGARVSKEKFGRELPTKAQYITDSRVLCKSLSSVEGKDKQITGWLNLSIDKHTNHTFLQPLYENIKHIPYNNKSSFNMLNTHNRYVKKYDYYDSNNVLVIPEEELDTSSSSGDQILTDIFEFIGKGKPYYDIENKYTELTGNKGEEFFIIFQKWKKEGLIFEPRPNIYVKK